MVSEVDRFMRHVSPEPNTGCWLWMAGEDRDGYGMFWSAGKTHRATHFSLTVLAGQDRPPGKLAIHSCDVPWCVNPNHLCWATQKENIADAIRKDRRRNVGPPPLLRGEKNNHAVLTEADVRIIRKEPRRYGSVRDLAVRYGVCRGTIKAVLYRKTWKFLA